MASCCPCGIVPFVRIKGKQVWLSKTVFDKPLWNNGFVEGFCNVCLAEMFPEYMLLFCMVRFGHNVGVFVGCLFVAPLLWI